MQAAKRLFPILHTPQQRHLAKIPLNAYNFLMDGPNKKIFGMQIDIDNQNKIAFTLLQILWSLDRFYLNFVAFIVSEISASLRINRQENGHG